MSETTSSPSESNTGPVATSPSPPTSYDEPRRRSRLGAAATWVGIVAGVVFIVAVIFFSGFILGKSSDGPRFRHHGGPDRDFAVIHRGPPPGFPMGPRGEFERSPFGGSGGSEGPRFAPPQPPSEPSAPTTTAPARP
ncbi:MAG TPA: hypothetical protein VHH12_10465 [Mycobacterium sp.]|nr:hypothetical protein [Mycobacterium sp.]